MICNVKLCPDLFAIFLFILVFSFFNKWYKCSHWQTNKKSCQHKNFTYLVHSSNRTNQRSTNHEFPNEYHRQYIIIQHTHNAIYTKKEKNKSRYRKKYCDEQRKTETTINKKKMYQFFALNRKSECVYNFNCYDHYDNIPWQKFFLHWITMLSML